MDKQLIKSSQNFVKIDIDSDLEKIIKDTQQMYSIVDTKTTIKFLILKGFKKQSQRNNKDDMSEFLDKIKTISESKNIDFKSDYLNHLDKNMDYKVFFDTNILLEIIF